MQASASGSMATVGSSPPWASTSRQATAPAGRFSKIVGGSAHLRPVGQRPGDLAARKLAPLAQPRLKLAENQRNCWISAGIMSFLGLETACVSRNT